MSQTPVDAGASSASPALAAAAVGAAALRALDGVLEDAHATLVHEVGERDVEPPNVMPPAKARPREPAEVLDERELGGGRRGR